MYILYSLLSVRASFWRKMVALLFLLAPLTLAAQSTKLIRQLQERQGDLQKQIAETESLLQSTRRDVRGTLNQLAALTGQIEERRRYITAINADIETVGRQLNSVERQLSALQRDLAECRRKYEASVQYLHKNRSIGERLMFIFAANNLSQTYRRLRYVREYATYQRLQGEDIKQKQAQVEAKRRELQEVKRAKEAMLATRQEEQGKLEQQEKQQRTLVSQLQKKQRGLQSEMQKKQREARQLNDRIDRLIAQEIEKARRRAEEEARREAARRKKESGKNPSSTASSGKKPIEKYTMNLADRQLTGSFASNRGRLPIPITGPYIIVSHYGQYAVEGLRGVKLDNKGIDIQGKPGAQARAVFGGKVAAVFRLSGLYNVLVRHGAYISVYCNLSSVSVKQGDEVAIHQTLGTVFSDSAHSGRTVLHFQLRQEKEKLNPELWLQR